MTQIAELTNKDFQTLMVNILKTVEKKRNKRAQMVENLRNQICKKTMNILQIKKKISELNKLGRVEQQTEFS